mmetsp:Transcript_21173/g.51692  ORF Transcript_21173/g.51692 Transcript_21173/m.51692 type:complete len:84 (+) Transcript_21173:647-898(+)
MVPLCSDANIHDSLGWNDRPFTRLLFVSHLTNMITHHRRPNQQTNTRCQAEQINKSTAAELVPSVTLTDTHVDGPARLPADER